MFRIVHFSIVVFLYVLTCSCQIFCSYEGDFEVRDSGILFTSSSSKLYRFLSQEKVQPIEVVCIFPLTNPKEAADIIRHIGQTKKLCESLKEIKILGGSAESSLYNSILPVLREFINKENGFIAIENPWWEPSLYKRVLNWFTPVFYGNDGKTKNNHIKVH